VGSLRARLPGRVGIIRGRGAAVDVEAVLDGEVLEIAQPRVDPSQDRIGVSFTKNAGVAREAAALRRFDDQSGEALAAPAVEPFGLGVFIDQALEVTRRAGETRGDERRRQVPDRYRSDPALGLGRLAGIADDEGIEHRQRPDHRLGETGRRQCDGLAGKPFQRAMRAHVHERIGLRDVAQPQSEGEQRVAGRQHCIVIIGAARARASAIGRQRDDDVAETAGAEPEGAIAKIRIVRRRTPGLDHAGKDFRGQCGDQAQIVVQRQARVFARHVARRMG
jgi:hypothetical protein